MKITVAKFCLYPSEDPSGHAVGFNVEASNGRAFYTDTVIPLTESQGKTDDQIISMAYEELKTNITFRVGELEQRSSLLGQAWTPVDERLPDDPEQPIEETLESVKNSAIRQMELKTQRFIETTPTGGDRYKWFQGVAVLNTKMTLMAIPEGSRTPEMINLLSRILEVEIWQQSVYEFFYAQVQSVALVDESQSVYDILSGFDLSGFNLTDPDMSLAELFIF